MWMAISAALQLMVIILQNKFDKDKAEQARKEALYAEAKAAIASGDKSSITSVFDRLR